MTLRIDTMCTRVSCCLACAVMSLFTLFLILVTSLVVAVPVCQHRALPKNSNRLLLVCLL